MQCGGGGACSPPDGPTGLIVPPALEGRRGWAERRLTPCEGSPREEAARAVESGVEGEDDGEGEEEALEEGREGEGK